MSARTRRGFFGHTAGAAVAAISAYFISRPGTVAKPQPSLREGTAIMRVGDRTVLVDISDFMPGGAEMVVFRHDGSLAIETPVRIGLGRAPRSFTGPTVIVEGEPSAYGVHVIGRVIGERGLSA